MATLTYGMFALLAAQGFAATVRSEYGMNVAADGKVEKFNANTDTDTAAETAQMVLAEMEDWARSGARPEEPKIKTIEGLAKELDKALVDTHAAAQDQVHKNIAEIEKCNADQASAIKMITETTKVTVGKQRAAHATCRDSEVVTFKDMQAKCKHLTNWLKQTSDESPTKPEGAADDEMVDYVQKMSGYWCEKGDAAQEKQKVCEKRKEDHRVEKEKCDALQAQFENGFCSWRTKLIDVCTEQTTCYDAAKGAYEEHVSSTQKLVVKWKTEYTALKKILCYVKVWLSDENPETVDAGELTRCQKLSPDDSNMDIDFGKAPEKSKCSLEDVANYPGTTAFTEIEYKKWAEFVNEASSCLEDEPEEPTAPATKVTCKLTIDNYLSGVKYNGKTLTTTYVSNGKVYTYAPNDEKVPHKDHHWNKAKTFSFDDAGAGVDLEISGFEHATVKFHGCKNSGLALECTASNPTSPWNKYGSDLSTWKAKGADTPSGLAAASLEKPCETTSGFSLTGALGFHKEIWPSNGKRYAEFSGSPYQ